MLDSLEWLTIAGLGAAILAAFAWWRDRRRLHRRDLDAVGLMPWTAVFFWSTLAAVALLGTATKAWLAG